VQGPGPAPAPQRDGPPLSVPPNLAELPDVVPQVEPIRPGGPNKPYVVLGQSYEPLQGDVEWSEKGGASWYGNKFHGRRTASGELYSMFGLTAAHKTLPIPSYVRVRNVRNGKQVIVRVNDRGPFVSGRVIDLSYAAAIKLDIVNHGVGQVEVSRLTFDDIRSGAWQRGTVLDPDATRVAESPLPAGNPVGNAGDAPAVVLPAPTPAPAVEVSTAAARAHTPAARGFWVQLAALSRRDGVDRLQQRIADQLTGLLPLLAVFHESPHYKLQAGPFASRHEAQQAARQVREALQLQPMVIERR
jgi:rare lipoprotein A